MGRGLGVEVPDDTLVYVGARERRPLTRFATLTDLSLKGRGRSSRFSLKGQGGPTGDYSARLGSGFMVFQSVSRS